MRWSVSLKIFGGTAISLWGGNRNKSGGGRLACPAKLCLTPTGPLLATIDDLRTSLGVSVTLDCCKEVPRSGWPINDRNVFLTILEAGKPKKKASVNPGSGL